jgi:poly(A) polymerase
LTPLKYSAEDLGFDRSEVSVNAMEVVQKLQQKGYQSYLVGGCVRDMILGLHPKDFDVTTDARPEQVKSLFGRSRIIGRRFKIVHVTFGRSRHTESEIIEVATYRAKATKDSVTNQKERKKATVSDSGRLLDDNVYGTLEQDVERRDFTVNALYYDPVNDVVLDYYGGVEHLKRKELHIIGDTATRFSEDPVRMLRAVRFKAKLNLKTGKAVDQEILNCASHLGDVPAARLFDEVLKLFHHGVALDTWKVLSSTPLGKLLFPLSIRAMSVESGHRFEELIVQALKNTDSRINNDLPVMAGYLYAVLLWKPFVMEVEKKIEQGMRRNEAIWAASESVFKQQNKVISIPWRVRSPAIEIWDLQPRLEKRIPRSIEKLLENRRFRAAYDFLELRSRVGEVDSELVQWWTDIQKADGEQKKKMVDALRNQAESSNSRSRKRNRRRNTGKNTSGSSKNSPS